MAEGDTNTNWFEGFDAETVGYLQSRGLDKKTAAEAVAETIKAHRNAESKLGIPSDRVLRMPDEGGDWSAVHKALGVPADSKEYDVTAIKDEKMADLFRTIAGEAKMTKAQAATLATKFATFNETEQNQKDMIKQTAISADRLALEQSWGANKESFDFIAKRAGELIGLTSEQLDAIATQAGYKTVMEGLLKLGNSMGEQRLLGVTSIPGASAFQPMTREQAADKLASLKTDSDFLSKWASGDKESAKLLDNLNRLVLGMKPVA